MMNDDLISLINDYLASVGEVVRCLRSEYGTDDLLAGWRKGLVPQEGSTSEGIEFCFHGVGCRAVCNQVVVDFDFGPEGRFDGFDEWRLAKYLDSRPGFYDLDADDLKNGLEGLLELGQIVKPGLLPSRHLYYFSGNFGGRKGDKYI